MHVAWIHTHLGDRRIKLLICLAVKGSLLDAYSQATLFGEERKSPE